MPAWRIAESSFSSLRMDDMTLYNPLISDGKPAFQKCGGKTTSSDSFRQCVRSKDRYSFEKCLRDCYGYAGILGINPECYTLRQLIWMVEGKGRYDWSMTASMMALEININRKKGAKAVEPEELNPFIRKSKRREKVVLSTKDSMDILKKVFCKDAK